MKRSKSILTQVAFTKKGKTYIVHYRDENGRYNSRAELKKVPRLGTKAFEQSVGFLRIIGGKNPLDNTDIHPESYPVAKKVLAAADVTAADLGDAAAVA